MRSVKGKLKAERVQDPDAAPAPETALKAERVQDPEAVLTQETIEERKESHHAEDVVR